VQQKEKVPIATDQAGKWTKSRRKVLQKGARVLDKKTVEERV